MSVIETRLTKALHLKFPLVVAPMAGGPSTVDLVVSSSEGGALGSLGAAYFTPEKIRDQVARIRARTQRPFAVNLFIPTQVPNISKQKMDLAIRKTERFREELGLPQPKLEPIFQEDFDRQFEAVLSLRPHVLSFVFGCMASEYIKEARQAGLFLIGTSTTLAETQELQESNLDAIVLQGAEAGGHRGIFDPTADDPGLGTFELLKAVRSKTKVPLIAAGGIMKAEDIKAALHAGADGVQMGTAFLATTEAGTSSPYRKKLLESDSRKTKLTRAFSGRLARGLVNRFMQEMDADPETILPFPVQNKWTRDLRNASAAQGSADFLSLWCGSGTGELWTGSAAALIKNLFS